MKSFQQPVKIKLFIVSRLKPRNEILTRIRDKTSVLNPKLSAQKKTELDLLKKETKAVLRFWFAYLDGVEGWQTASHGKLVHFGSEKLGKIRGMKAGQSWELR